MKCTIDRAGRLVIPKALRDQAGFKPGIKLDARYEDGNVVIQPVSTARLVRRDGLTVIKVPGASKITLNETNRLIRMVRERRI